MKKLIILFALVLASIAATAQTSGWTYPLITTNSTDTLLVFHNDSTKVMQVGSLLWSNGQNPLTANWNAGAFTITGLRFTSTQATGTAPFTVSSTTVVNNLNADLLDGQSGAYYRDNATHTGEVTGSTVLTIANNIINEDNLYSSNYPTDGMVLSFNSSTLGFRWISALTDSVWEVATADTFYVTPPSFGRHAIYNNNGIQIESNVVSTGSGSSISFDEFGGLGLSITDGSSNNSLTFGLTSTTFVDGLSQQGLLYDDDYSTNYTIRSLVDKGYVDAAIDASGSGVTVGTSQYEIPYTNASLDDFDYTSSFTFDGNLNIGNAGGIDQYGAELLVGGNTGTWTARTDNVNKSGYITSPHYDVDEENMMMIGARNINNYGYVEIGGGNTLYNAANRIDFYLGTTSTTTTGTRIVQITPYALKVDSITENTGGNGVSVDGVLLKDSDITANDSVWFTNIQSLKQGYALYYNPLTGGVSYGDTVTGLGGTGYWSKTGTDLSPVTAGDDILIPAGDYIYFGDKDSYILEAVDDNIYISSAGTAMRFTPTASIMYRRLDPNADKVVDLGTSSLFWDEAYLNRVYIDDASTYIDINTGSMTFTDAVTGTKTLAELSAGGGSSDSSWIKIMTDTIVPYTLNYDDTLSFYVRDNEGSTALIMETEDNGYKGRVTANGGTIAISSRNDALNRISQISTLAQGLVTLTSNNSVGLTAVSLGPNALEYNVDYSSLYTARSLVDSAFVANMVGAGGGSSDSTFVVVTGDTVIANHAFHIEQVASIADPTKGDIYYDSDDNVLRLYNGVDYDTLNSAGIGSGGSYTFSDGLLNTGGNVTLPNSFATSTIDQDMYLTNSVNGNIFKIRTVGSVTSGEIDAYSGGVSMNHYSNTTWSSADRAYVVLDQGYAMLGWRTTSTFSDIEIDPIEGMQVTDTYGLTGLYYNGDYSSNFTDRSLVDMGFVTSTISDSIAALLAAGEEGVALADSSRAVGNIPGSYVTGQTLSDTLAFYGGSSDSTWVRAQVDTLYLRNSANTLYATTGDPTVYITVNGAISAGFGTGSATGGTLLIGDAIQFNLSSNQQIYVDGSGNLTFDDGITGTKTLADLTNVYALTDTMMWYQYGAGVGLAGDTILFDTTAIGTGVPYGRKYVETDSLEILYFRASLSAGDTLNALLYYNDTAYVHTDVVSASGATIIDTLNITEYDSQIGTTGFSTTTVPPGMFVCLEFLSSTNGSNPVWFVCDLVGYIKRD